MLFNYNIDAFNLETIFKFIIPRRQNKTVLLTVDGMLIIHQVPDLLTVLKTT